MGRGWIKGLHPDDRDNIIDEWYRATQENRSFILEYRFQRPDGTVSWVFGQEVAERNAENKVTGYVNTITAWIHIFPNSNLLLGFNQLIN